MLGRLGQAWAGRIGVDFERIWDTPPLRIELVDGPGEDLVIAFSSVGHDPERLPSPEFVATALGRGTLTPRRALFVLDERRSWANAPEFELALHAALARVAARAPVRRVAAIGVSMGGFSALVAASFLPVDLVLAFSPQWSVLPQIIPGETRWSRWTQDLPPVRWPVAPLPGRAWTCLFHGMRDDLIQARHFPAVPGTDHILFPAQGHSDLVPHLKAHGALSGLLEAGLTGDRRRLLRIAASAGGRLRHRLFPDGFPPG